MRPNKQPRAGAGSRTPRWPRQAVFRRAPFVVCYWIGGQLVFQNYLTQRHITADPLTASILHFFHHWRSIDQLALSRSEYTLESLSAAVRSLTDHSFLQRRGDPAPGEKALQAWSEWNPAASFFHFSTKDLPFERDAQKEYRFLLKLAKQKPLRRAAKRYPKAVGIDLPEVPAVGGFPQLLLARRTWRKFSRQAMPLADVSKLLKLTWGVQRWVTLPKVGTVAAKTSPSGGALHPIEAYILACNVDQLRPGIYHYASAEHRLERIRRGATSRQIRQYLANQYWYAGASFVVFMTAVFGRTQWKYDYARAYRAVLMEAGHLCQTFCLTATWLGLAPFCTIAFSDSQVERALGIDGISESVLYVTGAGMRPQNERNAHLLSGSKIENLQL